MNKLMLVEQPFGIGDVIFTQSLVNDFIHDGYDVLWPVFDYTVPWLSYAYPKMKFLPSSIIQSGYLDYREDIQLNGIRFLPIRFAEAIMGREYKFHMVSKYELYNKDWRDWKRDAMPIRNVQREKELKAELGIKNKMKYNFVHSRFGAKGQYLLHIDPVNDYPNIEMRVNDGYSLFDYMGIIEGAETIQAVSSATLYLFEVMDLAAKEIHIYNRTPVERNLDYVRFIFSKDYILHE